MQRTDILIAQLLLLASMLLANGCTATVIPDTFTLRGGTTIYHEDRVKQANFVNGEATWRLKK